MDKIEQFRGEYRWLSNFHRCDVEFEGIMYPSSENAYQAAKSDDMEIRTTFKSLAPGKSKKLGSRLILRDGWNDMKLNIMYNILVSKFELNPMLKIKLIDTGEMYIEEGNNWGDTFWGVCDGKGKNHLGEHLMKIRSLYMSGFEF